MILPAPKVKITSGAAQGLAESQRSGAIAGRTLTLQSLPVIVASDLPAILIEDSGYGLQLELLRLRSGRRRGFVHPAPWVGQQAASGNRARCGSHAATSLNRPSEWSVTEQGQTFVMGGALLAWFKVATIAYVKSNGGQSQIEAPIPADALGMSNAWQGGRGVSPALRPCFFAWRYSVIDTDDPRLGRISGPLSPIVRVRNAAAPLLKHSVAGRWNRNADFDARTLRASIR